MWVLLILLAASVIYQNNDDETHLEDVFELINDGDKQIDFKNATDFIVLLGMSGSGKSTLAHFMSGDPDTLVGIEDNGKLIFNNTEGTIGNTISISKTLIPEIHIDIHTEDGIADTAGFVDSRNKTSEIAGSYFVNRVFAASERVKILLVLPHSALEPGNVQHLDALLSHVIKLVQDIGKYKNCFCLVLSKTKISISDDDEEVIYTKQLIKKYRDEYVKKKEQTTDVIEIEKYDKKIAVLDAILDSNKIAIFRHPEKTGPVSKSEYSMNNRRHIRKVILDSVPYLPTDINDFQYAVSDESESFIKDRIYPEINSRITKLLNDVSTDLVEHINVVGTSSSFIHNFQIDIDILYDILWNIDIENMSLESFQKLVYSCIDYLRNTVKLTVPKNEFSILLQQFKFFKSFTPGVNEPYENWFKLFTEPKEYMIMLKTLYFVINDVYETLGTAEVQKNKHKMFDKELLDINFVINETNTNNFLSYIKTSQLTKHHDKIDYLMFEAHVKYENYMIRDLNTILKLIPSNISCSDSVMVIQSNFVSIVSDVLATLSNISCENVTIINILAHEVMFFDSDLELQDFDVSIITDFLSVDSKVKLDVSGSTARVHPNLPESDEKGKTDGLMGLPGNPGGNVFLAILNAKNPNLFEVIANGGNGGSGQHGSNGRYSQFQSEIPNKFDVPYNPESEFEEWFRERAYTIKHIKTIPSNGFEGDIHVYIGNDTRQLDSQLAGDGGKGGYGGLIGNVKNLTLNNIGSIAVILKNGTIGSSGKGGKGWHLQGIEFQCWLYFTEEYQVCTVTHRNPKREYMAKDGASQVGERKPESRHSPFININDIIAYKLNLLRTKFLEDKASKFNMFLPHNSIITYYNLPSFLNELKQVELQRSLILPSTLESYLRNIIEIIKEYPTYDEDDRTLKFFLVSTISSMIWSMQVSNETVFVSDLYSYVDSAMVTVKELQEIKIIKAIENIKNKYSVSIDQNILEAQKYITRFVNEEFKEIFKKMQQTVSNLVDEVHYYQEVVTDQIDKLKAQKRQLETNLIAHSVLGFVNVAAAIISMMGPVGTAVGVALGAASSITEALVVGDVNVNENTVINLPRGIRNLLQDIKKLRQSRKKGHMELLVITCDTYLEKSDINAEAKEKLSEVKKAAMTIADITNIQEIDSIIQDGIKDLKNLFEALNATVNPDLYKLLNNSLNLLNYAEKASQIAAPLLDAMKKYADDYQKLQIVIEMIKENEKKLKDLADYEDGVYEYIVPLLDNMYTDMSKMEEEFQNQKPVSLVVKRWEVNRRITAIGNLISRFTEGFDVEKDFERHFVQLTEASNLVVTLYDQIQQYHEHKQFADYIGNLQQVGGGDIPISGPYINDTIYLRTSIISAAIRSQCNAIITSFKLQVFPFAHTHLGKLNIQNGDYCGGEDNSVIETIKTVKSELSKIRDTINNNQDQYTFKGVFDSNYTSSRNFADWNNNTHGDQINKLMQGEAIVLSAPIVGRRNAVKFNRIQLRFTRTDGGPDAELKNALESFFVEQTHFGNSIFKCDDYMFIVRTEPLNFTYSIEMNPSTGLPLTYNSVYDKLRKGDVSLSPHAMWRIQLTPARRSDYKSLEKFTKNNINIELIGDGQFVDRDVYVCKSSLADYYEPYSPLLKLYYH